MSTFLFNKQCSAGFAPGQLTILSNVTPHPGYNGRVNRRIIASRSLILYQKLSLIQENTDVPARADAAKYRSIKVSAPRRDQHGASLSRSRFAYLIGLIVLIPHLPVGLQGPIGRFRNRLSNTYLGIHLLLESVEFE
jgi:hypothetical protein